ncbi:alpha/beta hydrolase [Lacibacterium aquatile]|uniref:Alpha/beta hydrolase n=1 Tax=Lacibacterium aquatile TaxID=1168082 RepID=A0ABW5DX68_9PROT
MNRPPPPPQFIPRKGTYFFGGSGMEGSYIDGMISALVEVGMTHAFKADRQRWSHDLLSADMLIDATWGVLAHRLGRSGGVDIGDRGAFGTDGAQLNLIGYSYGSLVAAEVATTLGSKVDHLVLIASPISQKKLERLFNNPWIGKVHLIDLGNLGDKIHDGMGVTDLLALGGPLNSIEFVLSLIRQDGHFWYTAAGPTGQERRRALARQLYEMGLR